MTTKPLFLNQDWGNTRSLLPLLPLGTVVISCLMLIGEFYLLGAFLPVQAQDAPIITESLPPPPPVSRRSQYLNSKSHTLRPTTLEPPTYSKLSQETEYTFSAPKSSQSYRVEVFGNSDSLLSQVRTIEPQAFRKGDIIQAGIFQDRKNAQELLNKLALEGFWSRIAIGD
jgi:cell division protein FtsN